MISKTFTKTSKDMLHVNVPQVMQSDLVRPEVLLGKKCCALW